VSHFRASLLTATVLLGLGGIAFAQRGPGGPIYDPVQLPETKGKVAQYSLTPRGDVDGLILADGTEVHTPPRLETQLVFAVHPGDSVTIHGLKARAVPMIAAMSVTNDASGVTVMGGPPMAMGTETSDVSGKVKAQLHAARGQLDGVLLEDGTIVRLPPPEARRLADTLAVGKPLFVRGIVVQSALGRVVAARELGTDQANLTAIAAPHFGMGEHGMHGEHGGMHPHREMGGGAMGGGAMGGGMAPHGGEAPAPQAK
jgi:hypothetical protein